MRKNSQAGWLVGLLLIVAAAPPAAAQTLAELLKDPTQLLQRIDQIRAPGDAFVFGLRLTTYKGREASSVSAFTVHVKDGAKSLVRFTAPPANKGRLLLMTGDNMWIYIPGSRGALRISPQQRLLGQVAYGDIARVVFNLDYQVDRAAEETVDGAPLIRLDLRAKSRGAAHERIALWVERTSLRPTRAEFLALSGKVLKVGYYRGYRPVLGAERPMILEIHDAVRTTEHSVLEYLEMRKEDTPEAFFQRGYLEHAR
jgi:outer membrane lipoprotein-sorting protein